jgi:hypothetical protein
LKAVHVIPDDIDWTPHHEDATGLDTALSIFFALGVGVMFALVLVVALTFLW